jgi:hypothetical protein
MEARKRMFKDLMQRMNLETAFMVFEDKAGGIGMLHSITDQDSITAELHRCCSNAIKAMPGTDLIIEKNEPDNE